MAWPAPRRLSANQKWLYLFIDIVTYEVSHASDGELLSEGADRLVAKQPIWGRVFILCAGALITAHLANILDDHYDLLARNFWKRVGLNVYSRRLPVWLP